MKVLQICPKPPVPSVDGGCIAMNAITQGLLKKNVAVKVFSATTQKHPFQPELISRDYLSQTYFEHEYINTKVNAVGALMALIRGRSYNISRFYTYAFNKRLSHILSEQQFNIIHLETLYTAPYINTIRKFSKAPIILRSLNVEYKIWENLALNGGLFKRTYLNIAVRHLKKYEEEVLSKVDGVVAITEKDAESFKKMNSRVPVISVPLGIEFNALDSKMEMEHGTVFHLGAMDWLPNVEAVEWFLDKVWSIVINKVPAAKCYLAGRNMPEKFLKKQLKNVFIECEVKSADAFMRSKEIMIVPLLSGSGIRVKILEAMALGKTIVTTTKGASGIEGENNIHFFIGDTPEEFADGIIKCFKDPLRAKTVAENGRLLVKDKYDLSSVTDKLLGFYKSFQEK